MDQYSPKSSPRGARSPNVQPANMEGGGNLKFSIALGGQKPTIIQKGPFYLMKQEPLPVSETGANNLMASKGLEHSYTKLTNKKMKDALSSFLPNLPGVIDSPGNQDNSSLRGLIDKPPVVGKELHQLSYAQLAGFRLHPGPLPEQYRISMQVQTKKKRKHKKNKHKGNETPAHESQSATAAAAAMSGGVVSGNDADEREKRREKKHKKHDKDAEDRKRRKKEKKRKKNKEDKE